MKILKFLLPLLAGLVLATASTARAGDDSAAVTITGNLVCGKCTLHLTKSCQSVIQVTEDGQTNNYFLKPNDITKGFHDDVCGGGSENVTVTGTVKEKWGKKTMTATKMVANKKT